MRLYIVYGSEASLLKNIFSDNHFYIRIFNKNKPDVKTNCTDISSYNPQDVQATLLQLTAHTIAQAIAAGETAITRLLVCGGGAHNTQLLAMLSQLLPTVRVESTAAVSVDPNFVEAQMMAWLAHQMIIRQPLDLTTITGSTQKAILGVFYPAGIDK